MTTLEFSLQKQNKRRWPHSFTPWRMQGGSRVEGFDEVGQILLKYYQQLLGPHHVIRNHINPEIIQQGETISQEQQINLCADFTDREIKAAMFSIHKLKSPGPDGYSSGFFHSTWEKTGPLICTAIKHFFKTGFLP